MEGNAAHSKGQLDGCSEQESLLHNRPTTHSSVYGVETVGKLKV